MQEQLSATTPNAAAPDAVKKSHSFKFIDILRGMAAMLVAYFHLHWFFFVPDHAKPDPVTYYFVFGAIDLGKVAVAIFFIISGFLIPSTLRRPKANLKTYGTHRFFRLYPAYWLSILVFIASELIQGHPDRLNLRQILINLTMFQRFVGVPDVIGAFWTLQIEITFYLICAVLFVTGQLNRRRWLIAGAAFAAALTAVGRHLTHKELPVALFLALMLMFLGDTFRGNLRGSVTDREARQSTLAVGLVLIPVCLVGYPGEGLRYLFTYWIALAVFLLALRYRMLFEKQTPLVRTLEWLGVISYSFYVMHAPIGLDFGEFVMNSTHSRLLTALALFGSTIPAAALSYYLIELPCVRLGKRLAPD